MKKIEASNLGLLGAGENLAIAFHGKIVAVWTIPIRADRRGTVMRELYSIAKDYRSVDFFVVSLRKTSKPRILTNWYCIKNSADEVTHEAFSKKSYVALKESLEDKTVFRIM